MKQSVKCNWCPEVVEIEVTDSQLRLVSSGELIQHVLPKLSDDDREMLISGTCPKCWDAMMKEPEEPEEVLDPLSKEGIEDYYLSFKGTTFLSYYETVQHILNCGGNIGHIKLLQEVYEKASVPKEE